MSKIYAKDSFDRFGDDLCELLVSYLSFDDRFRCEGLSKQFQRTVFTSVSIITLNCQPISRLFGPKYFALKTIAKKCRNIQTIDCRSLTIADIHMKTCIQTLRDNCHRFSDIYCYMNFKGGIYWPTLTPMMTMVISVAPKDKLYLKTCHRLSHLEVACISDIFVGETEILATNLQSIECCVESGFTRQMMAIFVANNHKLKSLRLECGTEETLKIVIEFVDQLPELRELLLTFRYYQTYNTFLVKIGQNCKQLAKFSLYFHSSSDEDMVRTIVSMQHFRTLKTLLLSISSRDGCGPRDLDWVSVLKNNRRLTHLTLDLLRLDANCLARIDHYLPRLRHLVIEANNGWIDIKCFDDISRLAALQTLDIKSELRIEANDSDINELMSRCAQLESIKVRDCDGLREFNRYARNCL